MRDPARQPGIEMCAVCGNPSVMYLRHSGRHLCGEHVVQNIEERVRSTIQRNAMIKSGDRIAVALSGGKDSTALTMLLHRIVPGFDPVSMVAVTVDEGIEGYRDETIGAAKRLASELGIEHRIISFKDLFGDTLDHFLAGREAQACTVCGILRKKALATAANNAGATKIATGHNLDDEAQSVLMNILRGDLPRLVRDPGPDDSGCFIPRIKPLSEIFEKEIATYLMIRGAWNTLPECPYTRYAMRAEVRSMLSRLEYRYPGSMDRLMESRKTIGRHLAGAVISEPLCHCRECGDPCSGDYCQVCQLRHSLGR